LRTQAATQAVQFTIEKQEKPAAITIANESTEIMNASQDGSACSMEEGCVSCGS
jgi:ribonucleoside-diphosphate reductase alpha chain